MINSSISVKFFFSDNYHIHRNDYDSSGSFSYDFECYMNAVPRVGDNILLPSTDPNSVPLKDEKLDLIALSATVTEVYWNPVNHSTTDGNDVVIHASIDWL